LNTDYQNHLCSNNTLNRIPILNHQFVNSACTRIPN
jgi:hypothetical protein